MWTANIKIKEEILKKNFGVDGKAHFEFLRDTMIYTVSDAMEEYASLRVRAKEKEIERLKVQLILTAGKKNKEI